MAYLSAEERRQSIVNAAVEVIAREGLARATTRRIADRAQAPLGSLHYCFRNKQELIQLVADQGAAMLERSFDDVPDDLGFEQALRGSIDALWRWVRDNVGLQLALMELAMWRIREHEGEDNLYVMWNRFGGDLLREHLERGIASDGVQPQIPLDEIVRFINHRFDGLVFEYAASLDAVACQRQMDLLADAMVVLAVPGGRASARRATAPRRAAARRTAAGRRRRAAARA